MAMNASVSAIQDMEKTLADTVRNLDTVSYTHLTLPTILRV